MDTKFTSLRAATAALNATVQQYSSDRLSKQPESQRVQASILLNDPKAAVFLNPDIYEPLTTNEFRVVDIQKAAKRILRSQKKVKRFEHCPYVEATPSLYDHNCDAANRTLALLKKAGLDINSRFANDVILEMLIHDHGETWGEGDSLTVRNRPYHIDYKEFKTKVESMIVYLTWALALYEAKYGASSEGSLYEMAEKGGSLIMQAAKDEEEDTFAAVAEYFIDFVEGHQTELAKVFSSDAGKIAKQLVRRMEEFENYKEADAPDYVILTKLLEKLDTLNFAARNASYDKIDYKQYQSLIAYIASAKGAFLNRVWQYRKTDRGSDMFKIAELVLEEVNNTYDLLHDGTDDFFQDPESMQGYRRRPLASTDDDTLYAGGDALLISSHADDQILLEDRDDYALDVNRPVGPNSIVGDDMTGEQRRQFYKAIRVRETAPLMAELDRIKAVWDSAV